MEKNYLKIKDLKDRGYIDLYHLAIDYQVEAGNEPNDGALLGDHKLTGNFDWDETEEGDKFWYLLHIGEIEEALTLLEE